MVTLRAQMLGGFGRLQVGGFRTRFFDHAAEFLWIFQHGTRLEHVLVEGLSIMIRLEQGRAQPFQQRFFTNIGIGIVYKYTGIHITVGVDMEVTASARDTPAHKFSVVLEVHGKERLALAQIPDTAIDSLTLLRLGHQLRHSVVAHGHIMEIPDEIRALFNQHIEVFLGSNTVIVHAGIARGNTVNQFLLPQKVHRPDHLIVHTLTAAAVRGLFKAFQGYGGNEILNAQHIIGKLLINQRTICKAQENTIIMLLAQTDDIRLPHQRLSTGVDVHVYAHFLALADNVVDLVKGQVQPVAIFRRPAAGAVQVAGAGGIQQDSPGNIAVIFFLQLLLNRPADHILVDKKIDQHCLNNFRIHIPQDMPYKIMIGVFRVIHQIAELLELVRIHFSRVLFRKAQQLTEILLWILVHVIEDLLQAKFLDCSRRVHRMLLHFSAVDPSSTQESYMGNLN